MKRSPIRRRKRKRKKRVTPLPRLKRECDRVFSLFIRKRTMLATGGVCAMCLSEPIEHCFHIVRRRHLSVRFDPMNAVGSCRGCNFDERNNPDKYRKKYIAMVGHKAYDALTSRAEERVIFSRQDYLDMIEDFKRKTEDL